MSSVFRVIKNKDFTVMSNIHLQDKKLSLKAKGLLSQMLSLPDDWDYTLRGLATINKEGVNTIGNIVNELIDAGYIVREQKRDERGGFSKSIYNIYEMPQFASAEEILDESTEKSTFHPCHKNSDTGESTEKSTFSPCHKNSDTGESTEKSTFLPCHKNRDTDNRDTGFCDANKRLNKQNTNILNNNTNALNNINIYNHSFPSGENSNPRETHERKDWNETNELYKQYDTLIRDNISYDAIIIDMPEKKEFIDAIVNIIVEVMISTSPSVRICKEEKPMQVVKAKYSKLGKTDIEYVIECMAKNTTRIKDMRSYLRAVLYNAQDTKALHYQNAVNYDFHGIDSG